jgi:hypothetical protein
MAEQSGLGSAQDVFAQEEWNVHGKHTQARIEQLTLFSHYSMGLEFSYEGSSNFAIMPAIGMPSIA